MSDIKQYEGRSLGYKFLVPGPASVEAWDAKGGENSCLERAAQAALAWDVYPEIGRKFVAKISEITGMTPRINEKATARARASKPDAAEVPESPASFHAWATADATPEQKAALQSAIEAIAAATPIDPTPTSRAAKVDTESLDLAETLLAQGSDVYEAKIASMRDNLGDGYDVDRDDEGVPTKASLGRLIKARRAQLIAAEL